MNVNNIFRGFDYKPNDIEDEVFLSELPLSLMEENIRSQFDDPMEYRKNDFVQTFLNKYIYSKENITEDNEEEIDELHTSFISFMRDIFKDYLDIGLPNLEDMDDEDQEELIHYVYRFFIINIKKNFVNLILNYLTDHTRSICDQLPKKKDVTSLSLRKNITDEDDITIISNLSEAINIILSEDISVDEFINYCSLHEPSLEASYISDQYDNANITGNFISSYCNMLNDDFKVEIECKVRNKILKKYKKK